MLLKKSAAVLLAFVMLLGLFAFSASAAVTPPSNLTDGKISTKSEIKSPLIISDTNVHYINIIFWDKPCDFTLKNDSGKEFSFEGKFLHRLIEVPSELLGSQITLTFKEKSKISEIEIFNEKPDNTKVQDWENNDTVCDLLVFSTHADDEQLFFSGVLPLYATDGITEVQVVYFTDHTNNITRRHELLDGLWEVGVRRYPVISSFPDAYSESYEGALKNLKNAGYTEEDALKFQVEQIRKFKPLVILGHDLKGEYGHGQHILNATLLTRAVEAAANSEEFTDVAYGVYDTPKLYLHLYGENKIELDLDTPIVSTPYEQFKGKTPFEISKVGFSKHATQQGTWFKTWLNGKNGQITKATQITTYSPREFGLYRTTVGEDVLKNDVFENITRRALIPTETESESETEVQKPVDEHPQKTAGKDLLHATFICLIILVIYFAVIAILKIRKERRRRRRERRRQHHHHHHHYDN